MTLQLNLNGKNGITNYIYFLVLIGVICLGLGGFYYSTEEKKKSPNLTDPIASMSIGGIFIGIWVIFSILLFLKIIEHDPNNFID
jgi:hypothetical protein